jgi:L-malate glycosyltransferase
VSGIHQFVPMLHRADAVGRHTLRLREVLAARGISSHLYVEMDDPETASETRPFARYAEEAAAGDVLVYQFATASALAPWLAGRPEALVVNYHNVTPPEYYAPWDNGMARHQLLAQTQLRQLAPRAALGLAVSAFNEGELRAAGFVRTAVVPPAAMAPLDAGAAGAGGSALARSPVPVSRRGGRWLTVGRLAPNKGIEYAVMALLVSRAHDDPAATLDVVGREVVASYTAALHRFVDDMGLHHAVRFHGALRDPELVAAMADADVLVMTSRHEGFGVPVVEAMTLGLPVVVNHTGALPEVVGDGGLLVDTTDPWALAGGVTRLLREDGLQRRFVEAAARRVTELDLTSAGERAVDLLVAQRSAPARQR